MAWDQAGTFRLGWSLALVAAAGFCWAEVSRNLYAVIEGVAGARRRETKGRL